MYLFTFICLVYDTDRCHIYGMGCFECYDIYCERCESKALCNNAKRRTTSPPNATKPHAPKEVLGPVPISATIDRTGTLSYGNFLFVGKSDNAGTSI